MKKVGAKSFDIIYFMNSFSLKRDFLYFDEIYYSEDTLKKNAEVGKWLSKAVRGESDNLFEWKMYEIEQLKEKGVLIPFIPTPNNSYEECQAYQAGVGLNLALKEMDKAHEKVRNSVKGLISKSDTRKYLGEVFDHSGAYSELEAILIARCYNFHRSGCIPIIQTSKNPSNDPLIDQAIVINTIIQDFPYLIVTTDWSEIINYKQDPTIQQYFAALKNWLIDLVRSGLNRDELEERLAYFKSEYIKHSRYHEMKVKYAELEKNVLTPLSLIENVIKGNLTEIGKTFLDKKKESLDLQIEADNLKFQEVAYLVKTKETFDNDKSKMIKAGTRKN